MSQIGSKKIEFQDCAELIRFYGMWCIGLLVALLVISNLVIKVFLLLGLAAMLAQFIFHGSTYVSTQLTGQARTRFQVAVSLVAPAILSLYFIKDTPVLTFDGVAGHLFNAWFLVPLGIIGCFSWAIGDNLHREHPFRGFLIAAAILFVICLFGYHGIHSEYDEMTETSSSYVDSEVAEEAARTGKFLAQFLLYVATSYAAMFLKFRRNTAGS